MVVMNDCDYSMMTQNNIKNKYRDEGEEYVVSNLSKKDTCSYFRVDDPYFGLRVNFFQ